MGSAKFVLAVVAVWGVPVHYFDVPSANYLDFAEKFMGMSINSLRNSDMRSDRLLVFWSF
uniref:RxLR effector candidate protein n=1 Tax=Hyaloperonospora arabidopsidis (strain Emoy2) TaxID=559515 RepID=M4C205_HYAAE